MRPGRGKNKGGAFERHIGKTLSLWLTAGQDGTQLIRSVSSGGWARGREEGAAAWRHVGDLAPNGPAGDKFRRVFAVECKHYKCIDFWDLWTRQPKAGTIHGWWIKLQHECSGTGCLPMLIFRANMMPTMVTVPQSLIQSSLVRAACFSWRGIAVFPLEDLLGAQPGPFLAGDLIRGTGSVLGEESVSAPTATRKVSRRKRT